MAWNPWGSPQKIDLELYAHGACFLENQRCLDALPVPERPHRLYEHDVDTFELDFCG